MLLRSCYRSFSFRRVDSLTSRQAVSSIELQKLSQTTCLEELFAQNIAIIKFRFYGDSNPVFPNPTISFLSLS